ncbi:hypothetical protein BD779DRAFT_1465906 [Infundibulicybe gibba]|nr:hypothetical protein BD779DRAFT_1465906 [Infundibulicybe gibba]
MKGKKQGPPVDINVEICQLNFVNVLVFVRKESHFEGWSIEKLSEATRARLRSTQILSSLPEIVSELVQNALDADAHHIEIGVDCSEEGRYSMAIVTSKLYAEGGLINSLSTFGFRGEGWGYSIFWAVCQLAARDPRNHRLIRDAFYNFLSQWKTQAMGVRTSSSLATFRHLFGRALTEHIDEINVTAGDLKLEGFISLNGAHSKAYQFLLLLLNMRLTNWANFRALVAARRSPRRTEKKPVYVLNLTVPPQDIDNCLEPAKTVLCFQDLTAVKSLLSTSVQDFLSRHQFIREKRPMEGTSSPYRKRRKYDESSGSSEGSNKLGTEENELMWTDPTTGTNFVVDSRTGNSRPQLGRAAESIPNTIQPRQTLHLQRPNLGPESNRAEMPQWIQQALEVNDAYAIPEGNIPSLKFPSVTAHTSDQHNCHNTSRSQYFGTVDNASSDLPRRFRKEALHQARVINQVDRKFIACLIKDDQEASDRSHEVGGRALVLVDQHAADERVRVERFLKELCLGFLHNQDQHENDLGEAIPVKVLSPPLPLLLTRHEVLRLGSSREMQRAFRNWGFQFEDTPTDGTNNNSDENSGYMQLFVRAIPEVVSGKAIDRFPPDPNGKLMLGDELRDLVKGFFAQLEIDEPLALPLPPERKTNFDGSKPYGGALDGIPLSMRSRKAIPRPPPQYWVSLRVKATWAWRSSLVKTESQLLKYFGPMPMLQPEKSIDSLYLSVGAQFLGWSFEL